MTAPAQTSTITADWLTALTRDPAAAFVWRNPPPSRSHKPDKTIFDRRRYFDRGVLPDDSSGRFIAGVLRSRPGSWAVIFTGDHFVALHLQQYIKFGRRGFRYAAQYEAVLRVVDSGPLTGATDLYARYVGASEVWNGTPIY